VFITRQQTETSSQQTPAASPEPVTPVSHPMAQEMLYDRWGRMVHRYVDGQIISITV